MLIRCLVWGWGERRALRRPDLDLILQIPLHLANRHLLAVEDAGGQGGLGPGAGEDFQEVVGTARPTGGNNRDGHRRTHRVDQFQVKTRVGAVLINAIQQNLPSSQLLADLGQGDRVHRSSLATALDGALVPAV